jgi:predicted phage terminase large subunit-like protein
MTLDLLQSLKTPAHLIAKQSLLVYTLLYNRDIEPAHNYCDKFFGILIAKFQEFYDTKNDLLLLEAPPRTGKTEFDINIFLTWLLGKEKNKKFIVVGSNKVLKKNIRWDLERVINSPIYQEIFPEVKILICNESEITLTNGNRIVLTTTSSTVPIGAGFHWMFFIDFFSGETMRSEVLKEEAFAKFSAYSRRVQHNPTTKIIIDNQRLGVEDLSSFITSQYNEMKLPYIRLTFPFLFEEDFHYELQRKTVTFKKGEYLVSRFNDEEKRKIIAKDGDLRFVTEYQQNPRHARGDLVKREMFRFYSNEDLLNTHFVKGFITTDLALEDKRRNDYNVFCFWLVDNKENLYLIDMFRHKIKGLEAEKALYNFYLKWKDGLSNGQAGCNFITFEDTTNTKMTIQRYEKGMEIDGKKIYLAGLVKKLTRVKNKFSRLIDSLGHIQAGKVFLPSHDVKINGVADTSNDIVEPFIREYEAFREDDTHEHDDIVDSATDAIMQARKPEMSLKVQF